MITWMNCLFLPNYPGLCIALCIGMAAHTNQSQGSASPTSPALHHSGEEQKMTTTPTLSINRTHLNGKPAIELVVRHATAELRPILDGLGILPTVDMANRRSIICTTPAELDA